MRPNPELALALVRVTTGLLFVWTGAQVIFERGLGDLSAEFTRLSIPLPLLTAPLSATLQLVAGLLVTLGLASRVQATALCVLTAALLGARLMAQGYSDGLVSASLPMLIGSLSVAVGGGGRPALERAAGLAGRIAPRTTTKRSAKVSQG